MPRNHPETYDLRRPGARSRRHIVHRRRSASSRHCTSNFLPALRKHCLSSITYAPRLEVRRRHSAQCARHSVGAWSEVIKHLEQIYSDGLAASASYGALRAIAALPIKDYLASHDFRYICLSGAVYSHQCLFNISLSHGGILSPEETRPVADVDDHGIDLRQYCGGLLWWPGSAAPEKQLDHTAHSAQPLIFQCLLPRRT